jgi:16S rRNA (cytidine1402-2'-O)-methyltransferase
MLRTAADLGAVCGGQRRVALARELTKLHEQVWRGTLGDALAHLAEQPPRGEYVVVLEGAAEPGTPDDDALRAALTEAVARGLTRKDAVASVAALSGAPRRRVYDLALQLPR